MKIISISNTPHNKNQGSGYGILGYVDGLRKRGHTVNDYGRCDWEFLDVKRGRRYVYPIMIAFFGLSKYFSESYDLVEVWGGEAWLLSWILKMIRISSPVVHHSNGIEQHRRNVIEKSELYKHKNKSFFDLDLSLLHDIGLRSSDAIVTLSSYDSSFLDRKNYTRSKKAHPIETPLPEYFTEIDVSFSGNKKVGFCGSWIPRKGTSTMKSDIPKFLRENPGWEFSIVGVGNSDVVSTFPTDVRDQIEVIPFLEREKLIDWYRGLSIFTLPTIYDSFGLVMSEAMACGAALVATNVGFAYGLEHEREAYILPSPQSPHLKEALTKLTENEDLRREIAQNGYDRVQDLRWNDAVDRLERIYMSLAENHSESTASTI